MATQIEIKKWKLHQKKLNKLTLWGLKMGYIELYDDQLIQKLRNIYSGGIPASIILLSNGMTNGHCYDRAMLMSQAFLDTDDDVNLIYASIDSLRLNPKYLKGKEENHLFDNHCIVERITKDGRHLIYDTSTGLIYDKNLYWLIEHPKVRKINNKESIKEFIKREEFFYPEDPDAGKYASTMILPMIEMTFGRPTEMYSQLGIELLQREIEEYKKRINYDEIVREVEEDMVNMFARRK